MGGPPIWCTLTLDHICNQSPCLGWSPLPPVNLRSWWKQDKTAGAICHVHPLHTPHIFISAPKHVPAALGAWHTGVCLTHPALNDDDAPHIFSRNSLPSPFPLLIPLDEKMGKRANLRDRAPPLRWSPGQRVLAAQHSPQCLQIMHHPEHWDEAQCADSGLLRNFWIKWLFHETVQAHQIWFVPQKNSSCYKLSPRKGWNFCLKPELEEDIISGLPGQ